MNTADALRDKAALCRRMAAGLSRQHRRTSAAQQQRYLLELAKRLDREADLLERGGAKPKPKPE